jgi:hypothetical protein
MYVCVCEKRLDIVLHNNEIKMFIIRLIEK